MRKVLWYQLNLDKSNCICGSPAAGGASAYEKNPKNFRTGEPSSGQDI
jgi:hypothetical protein